jgi:hypothetical protein
MRVEKREFTWEFSQLSCHGQREQELHESWWELRSESLHESFLNSHVPVQREQELHKSWWELRSESLHESFLNSHVPVQREQDLHKSWWELRSESLHESFLNSHVPVQREEELHKSWWELRSESLHESFLNSHVPVQREEELHKSWLDVTARVAKLAKLLSTLIKIWTNTKLIGGDESAWASMRIGGQTQVELQLLSTAILILVWPGQSRRA